jgi:TatD DNase family protein
VLELVNQYPQEFDDDSFYSIGIHPGILSLIVEADLGIIESKLQEKNCLWRMRIRQRNTARVATNGFEQLLLAQKYNKPVVIHCVAAFQEVIDTKKRFKISVPHDYSRILKKGTAG